MLVLAPQFVYLSFGATFLLIGLSSLMLPRRPAMTPTTTSTSSSSSSSSTAAALTALAASHVNPLMRTHQREMSSKFSPAEIHRRQKQLLTRVGIFGWLYASLMICLASTSFYEWWGRETWLRAPEPSTAPRVPSRPLLQLFVLRLVVTLGAGVMTAAWIWWPEAATVCRRISHCKQPPRKCHPVPVVHCYSAGTAASPPHQIHHLTHLTPPQQHPLLHQHAITNPQIPHRNYKKHRKHRKHHSGSETQVWANNAQFERIRIIIYVAPLCSSALNVITLLKSCYNGRNNVVSLHTIVKTCFQYSKAHVNRKWNKLFLFLTVLRRSAKIEHKIAHNRFYFLIGLPYVLQ